MKTKQLLSALLALPLILLAACGGSQSSPEGTINAMADALKSEDASAFVELMDPQALSEPGVKSKLTGLVEMSIDEAERRGGVESVEILDLNEDGDTASAKISTHFGEGDDETETMNLVKRDGKWYLTP